MNQMVPLTAKSLAGAPIQKFEKSESAASPGCGFHFMNRKPSMGAIWDGQETHEVPLRELQFRLVQAFPCRTLYRDGRGYILDDPDDPGAQAKDGYAVVLHIRYKESYYLCSSLFRSALSRVADRAIAKIETLQAGLQESGNEALAGHAYLFAPFFVTLGEQKSSPNEKGECFSYLILSDIDYPKVDEDEVRDAVAHLESNHDALNAAIAANGRYR